MDWNPELKREEILERTKKMPQFTSLLSDAGHSKTNRLTLLPTYTHHHRGLYPQTVGLTLNPPFGKLCSLCILLQQ